jgi:uncharacterized membrane protein
MRLLDILIGTLVVFPLVADAIWWEVLGRHSLESSDLAVPLLLAVLLVLAAQRLSLQAWKPRVIAQHVRNALRIPLGALSRAPRGRLWCSLALLGGCLAALVFLYWAVASQVLGAERVSTALRKLTYGTGAFVVIGLVALAVRRRSSEPWEKSFFIRHGMNLVKAWVALVERSPARVLWSTVVILTAFFFWVGVLRYRAFDSHGYDLGIFTNAIWNLVYGNGYFSSVKGGINLFSDHQSPLFWALAPLFRIAPAPETLLLVQALGVMAGGPALYYLARAKFGRGHWAPAALPWLYWTWLPLRNALAFDFHPEVFMLPLILWAFVGFGSDRPWARVLGLLAVLAALGAKESAGVVVVGIGVAWALTGETGSWRARWPGVALAAAGAAVFLFDVNVVPGMFGEQYAYLGSYERFGGGIASVLLAPFTQPAYFLSQFLNMERLNFLFWTLAPLGLLPLLDWRAALAALPPYLMLFLAEGDQRVALSFHYGIEPGTALFWALPLGLAASARRFGWRRTAIWMLFCSLAFIGPSELARMRYYRPSPHAQWLASEALPCLDREAPMAASDVLIPHLATRAWISYPELISQEPSGAPVSCIVTDLSEGIHNWPLGTLGVERVRAALPERGYREAYRCGAFSVHQLRSATCLRCLPACDRPPASGRGPGS